MISLLFKFSAEKINNYAFFPSFVASPYGIASPYYNNLFTTTTYRKQIYDFCKVTTNDGINHYCSLITFASFDNNQVNFAISTYFFQLQQGACSDSFTTTTANFDILINNPPQPLIQPYQECTQNPTIATISQLGIIIIINTYAS